jgi:hypothetical protein
MVGSVIAVPHASAIQHAGPGTPPVPARNL